MLSESAYKKVGDGKCDCSNGWPLGEAPSPLPLREDCARYEPACPFEPIRASHAQVMIVFDTCSRVHAANSRPSYEVDVLGDADPATIPTLSPKGQTIKVKAARRRIIQTSGYPMARGALAPAPAGHSPSVYYHYVLERSRMHTRESIVIIYAIVGRGALKSTAACRALSVVVSRLESRDGERRVSTHEKWAAPREWKCWAVSAQRQTFATCSL